jgi:hypothetical protein
LIGRFDRNDAVETHVACFIHLAHAARTQGYDDLVRAQASPGG